MGGLEIALLVIGLILIVISFFVVDKSKEEPKQNLVPVPDMKQLNVISERAIKDMNTTANKLLESTEDSLEAISNDKIMAVNEYSDQVLSKIDANHKEVVFLYQMLQDKETELKSTVANMEKVRIECEKFLHDNNGNKNYFSALDSLSASNDVSANGQSEEKPRVIDIGMKDFSFDDDNDSSTEPSKDVSKMKSKDRAKQRLTTVSSDVKQEMIKHAPEKTEKTNEVIALYKKKKSVMEISKLLNMGQGEVKLIIDLYCK